MDSHELNELIKTVQSVIGPELKAIKDNIQGLRESSERRYISLESQINSLSCKEHNGRLNAMEKSLIALEMEVAANKKHNEKQDDSRNKTEARIWTVLCTIVGGVIIFLIKTYWK